MRTCRASVFVYVRLRDYFTKHLKKQKIKPKNDENKTTNKQTSNCCIDNMLIKTITQGVISYFC
eukprot:m.45961 g.45961  ORF g.45961 m.45961 type:complete len:64 (+) comp20103_c0_seq1:146-337(+)